MFLYLCLYIDVCMYVYLCVYIYFFSFSCFSDIWYKILSVIIPALKKSPLLFDYAHIFIKYLHMYIHIFIYIHEYIYIHK